MSLDYGARAILERCRQRDKEYERKAIAAERDGDSEGCWFYMALRRENGRLMQRIEGHLQSGSRSA